MQKMKLKKIANQKNKINPKKNKKQIQNKNLLFTELLNSKNKQ
jgi:hypothetical protein